MLIKKWVSIDNVIGGTSLENLNYRMWKLIKLFIEKYFMFYTSLIFYVFFFWNKKYKASNIHTIVVTVVVVIKIIN
jgi:hypothetical protein